MVVDPAAIEAGSTAYGDRAPLEAGLESINEGGGGAPIGGGGTPSPTTTMDMGGDPIASLLSGSITPDQSMPITSGLSVGPGSGPLNAVPASPTDNDLGNKLKQIASQSTSPTLRRLANARLKRMYRGNDG